MALYFRSGQQSDAIACIDILRDWVEETSWMPTPDERQELAAYWSDVFENDLSGVAEMGGRIVGFRTCSEELVGALYVAPEARGAGIGKRLPDLAKENRDRISAFSLLL